MSTHPTEEIEAALARLDLEPIIFKLTHSGEGHGWTREKAERIAPIYKRFLFLTVTAGEPIVPTLDIDDFWHAHILDTRKYMADCDKIFGFYLHHFPYFGLRGDIDAANLRHAAERTRTLYLEHYGESYLPGEATNCDVSCQACAWPDVSPTQPLTATHAAVCSVCRSCSSCAGEHIERSAA
ncbi:MAG: hypothetical protein Q8R07_02060 [Candidatus Uhrbacteria bacterium]|nr:hypothetical protein [Candidatus Uhrbacteria bacterium]